MKLHSETHDYKGHKITINVHHDEDPGAPWEEHDGHGIVSDWVTRDKRPGELVLCSDRGSNRFYDYAGTMKLAKQDGWGLGDKARARLAAKLGRQPTKGEIIHAAVMADYEHLRGWCNDEWTWKGYTLDVETLSGELLENMDACWGYDDEDYMLEEAKSQAEHFIDNRIKEQAKEQSEAFRAACADITTV